LTRAAGPDPIPSIAPRQPRGAYEIKRSIDPEQVTRPRPVLLVLAFLVTALFAVWTALALLLGGGGSGGITTVRGGVVVLFAIAWITAWRRGRRAAVLVTAVAFATVLLWFLSLEPSNDRDWSEDQSRTARAIVEGAHVTLRDVRDFRYDGTGSWDARWYDLTVDTSELEGIDFFLIRFAENPTVGHTMVSFRFAGERFVVVSIEVRKERGERFGLLKGLFRQFELAYVVGDERDLVQLRTNHRGDDVYLYPCAGSHETQVAYFLELCRGIERLHESPAFYDTVGRNCTTVLARHWERVMGVELGFDHRILLPGLVDELVAELGLIESYTRPGDTGSDTYISARARAADGVDDFSQRIRR